MARKRRNTLPPSPLAWRVFESFEVGDTDQARADVPKLREWFARLEEQRRRFDDELDRALSGVEAWADAVCTEAGLGPHHAVGEGQYPDPEWYAAEIRGRIAELWSLRRSDPEDAIVCALYLGELIGEARAHLQHGQDAARGLHLANNARKGHEAVHGGEEQKERRWRQQLAAYQKHLRAGHKKTLAVQLAAEELKVSRRSIYNARDRFE